MWIQEKAERTFLFYFRSLERLPCLHDNVLAAAADAAFSFSSNQKKKQVLIFLICSIFYPKVPAIRKQFNKLNYFATDNCASDSSRYCQRVDRGKNLSCRTDKNSNLQFQSFGTYFFQALFVRFASNSGSSVQWKGSGAWYRFYAEMPLFFCCYLYIFLIIWIILHFVMET